MVSAQGAEQSTSHSQELGTPQTPQEQPGNKQILWKVTLELGSYVPSIKKSSGRV